MEPVVVEVEKVVEATITPEMAVNALKEGLKTDEDWLKIMPVNRQEQMRSAMTLHEDHKSKLVDGILANTEKDTWVKEELDKMEVNQLKKIAKTAGFTAKPDIQNYAGQGPGAGTQLEINADEVEHMLPTGMELEETK